MSELAAIEAEVADTELARLRALEVSELLRLYGSILEVLRERSVIRSENSPVGDYAELLASTAFGLTLTSNSTLGYDGTDAAGVRWQVKGRRISRWNPSRQMSSIRGLGPDDPDPFDVLAGVLFNPDFSVMRAAIVPVAVVRERAKLTARVGASAYRFDLTDAVWLVPSVRDVTEEIRVAVTGVDAAFGPRGKAAPT